MSDRRGRPAPRLDSAGVESDPRRAPSRGRRGALAGPVRAYLALAALSAAVRHPDSRLDERILSRFSRFAIRAVRDSETAGDTTSRL